MRKYSVPSAAVFVLGLIAGGCNDATKNANIFRAQLSPANEIPGHSTGATGAAGISFENGVVTYSIEVHGISDITFSHIHSGGADVNGPVRVFLFRGPKAGPSEGVLVEGSFTAADVTGVTFEELINQMKTGQAYVNVHTNQFPGGEMRGQVQLVQ
jgi:hypothetical protein